MRIFFAVSLLALSTPICMAQSISFSFPSDTASGPTSAPKTPVLFDVSAIDKAVNPCDDFYEFACGNWRRENPIPADQAIWNRFNELREHDNYLLYTELKKAADTPSSPLQKKYGDFFAACMNVEQADKRGAEPLQPELEAIDTLKSTRDLAALNVELVNRFGSAPLLGVRVVQDEKNSALQILATGQGGLSLPDRDYYLNPAERFVTIRAEYLANVKATFELLGDTPSKAQTEAEAVMKIETVLAQNSMERVAMRDPNKVYHPMKLATLQELTPDYNWTQYLDGIGMGSVPSVDVMSPEFDKAVGTELQTESLSAWKSYLRWQAVHRSAPWLSSNFVQTDFDFFARTLQGQQENQPRWKRCTQLLDRTMGEAVGQDWVRQNFPPNAKDSMEKLVKALETALGQDIQQLPWMTAATKQQAEMKLGAITDKIGYPAHWRDYSSLSVQRGDLLADVDRSEAFELRYNLDHYGKPVDKSEWHMTPPTVNAYYSPAQNNINFPAGILQPPFYDVAKDPAVNFGGIGVVIGHEMTHGFDDQGSQYDLNGNVRVWWTPEDLTKFKARTECEAKEYDGFQVAPGQTLNGHLTLGENTADNGGIRIAYQALMNTLAAEDKPTTVKIDGYTPAQRFFIAFGQIWCENRTEQTSISRAKTDPHSSGEWRVKGTVQNFDEFGKAFGCHAGQPMMPANGGCRVW